MKFGDRDPRGCLMHTDQPHPERRSFLRWAIHGLGALFAAILGIPAVAYLIDARNRPPRQAGMRRVARLSELRVGEPKEVVIRETRQDAWTLHPDVEIGRVWLVRRDNNEVDAFTTVCPHLGCSINCTGTQFLCPCHGGQFELNGKRTSPRPVPRDMDLLHKQMERDPAKPADFFILVKYEKFKTSQETKEVEV
jgi:menaquinol-cytochrome c reductase iron-sulfur subunit